MIMKYRDEQPNEEIDRVKSGKVPITGASVAMELGCLTVHPPGSTPSPSWGLGFYGGFVT